MGKKRDLINKLKQENAKLEKDIKALIIGVDYRERLEIELRYKFRYEAADVGMFGNKEQIVIGNGIKDQMSTDKKSGIGRTNCCRNRSNSKLTNTMSKYRGQLADFPDEVVEWMLDQQEAQGNKRDVSVFEKLAESDKIVGGFSWVNTKEGKDFCHNIIFGRYFDLFFEKYPKKTPEPTQTPDFDERRFQSACAAMRGILSNPHYPTNLNENKVAAASVTYADALIEALKKGKQDDTTTTP